MKVTGGKRYYGEAIGILMLDVVGLYPMIAGDVGNASSYDFPVRMKVIKGLPDNPFPPLTDSNGNYTPDVIKTIEAAKEMEADGVLAIVMCCGFFSLVQKVLAKAVNIPVFTSPLMLVPLIERMIRPDQTIGIVTASAKNLSYEFLEPVGIQKTAPIVTIGLEKSSEFYATHMGGTQTTMDIDLLKKEVVEIVKETVAKHPDMGAILLECTTLPTFAADIQKTVNLPVFDYIGFINLMYQSVVQKNYQGFL